LLAVLPEDQVQALMKEADDKGAPMSLDIDIENLTVRTLHHEFTFVMSARHRRMFLEGLDVIGLTLKYKTEIDAFAQEHWNEQPWVKDVARKTMDRLN
jgi:3-isopropylmalate/(R)-2-methylmalate dehydratase small subunit